MKVVCNLFVFMTCWVFNMNAQHVPKNEPLQRHIIAAGAGKFFWYEGWNTYLSYTYKFHKNIGICGGLDVRFNNQASSFNHLAFSALPNLPMSVSFVDHYVYPSSFIDNPPDLSYANVNYIGRSGIDNSYMPFIGLQFEKNIFKKVVLSFQTSIALEYLSRVYVKDLAYPVGVILEDGRSVPTVLSQQRYIREWKDLFWNNELRVGYNIFNSTYINFRYVLYTYNSINEPTNTGWGTGTMSIALGLSTYIR